MGLLDLNWDALNSDQGRMALGLLAAAGPQERPMSFGQRLAGAMDQFRSQKAAEDERKLKAQVMQAQLEDIKAQALQRNAAAQQLLEGQRALSDVLGNPGAVNQYDTPGSGLSLGGVREQMTPRAAGLAGATPEQIARLKANKIDVESLWQHAKTGLEIKPGSFYKDPTTGQVRYQADPTKGVSFDGERVSLTPGALEAQSALADATKTAEARASAKYQPMYSEGPGGKTLLGSTADVLDGQRPKPAQPIESRVRDMMALFGDKSAQYDIGGQRGSIGDSGPGLKVGPSSKESAMSEYDKEVQKQFAEHRKTIMQGGVDATGNIERLSRLDNLLSKHDGGLFSAKGLQLAQGANSLGFKIDPQLGNKEAAQSLSNEMALQLRNPSGGAGMPGAMSDADREYLRSMVPSMSQSSEGRRKMVDAAMKVEQRKQEVAEAARKYESKYGRLDNDFFTQLSAWSAAHPLFPRGR